MNPEKQDPAEPSKTVVLGTTSNGVSIAEVVHELAASNNHDQQGDYEQPTDGRGAHIQKRIDRKQYRQWESNLRSKMKAWVK
jgi:hypothetical protein